MLLQREELNGMGRHYANAMLGVMDEAMHEARHEGGLNRPGFTGDRLV